MTRIVSFPRRFGLVVILLSGWASSFQAFSPFQPVISIQSLLSSRRTAYPSFFKPTILHSSNPDDVYDSSTASNDGMVRTLPGGSSLLFDMVRRMNTAGDAVTSNNNNNNLHGPPRWHPVQGISPHNPHFRTTSPSMDTHGYAQSIWRNARKGNSPAMWRYALRVFDRIPGKKTIAQYEGALQACAKLGDWKRAMEIYQQVQQLEEQEEIKQKEQAVEYKRKHARIQVTEPMVASLVRASVRAVRQRPKQHRQLDPSDAAAVCNSTEPLEAALQAVLLQARRSTVPLVARHVNPIAAAYQYLGQYDQARAVLCDHLTDRTSGPEDEVVDKQPPTFNIYDLGAKDKASYTLLVQGAVSQGNWTGAVDALVDMTSHAGLYPTARHLNAWTEVSERQTKQRTTRSWKKKREEYWLDSVRASTSSSTATTTNG